MCGIFGTFGTTKLSILKLTRLLETQQGTGIRGLQLDLPGAGRARTERGIRGCPAGWSGSLQPHEQVDPRMHKEDPNERYQLPVDGKYPTVSSGSEELRSTSRGNFPNGWSFREEEYPTSTGGQIWLDDCHWRYFSRWFCLSSPSDGSPKNTLNSRDHRWDQKWPTRMKGRSRTLSWGRTRVNLTCKWATTKGPPNLDTVVSATHVTCKIINHFVSPLRSFLFYYFFYKSIIE